MYNPYNNNYNNYPCNPWPQNDMMYDQRRRLMPNYPMYPVYPNYPNYPNQYYTPMYPDQFDNMYNRPWNYPTENGFIEMMDYGPEPFVVNINEAAIQNDNYRTALWTGEHMQLTLMSIDVGEDIGLEIHPDTDQFFRVEQGEGVVMMGDSENMLDFEEMVSDDFAFIVPAGKWHNVVNTGNMPLKLYSIYAPPRHPHGTIHETKEDVHR